MQSNKNKTEIVSLCYNAMFKAVFGNNKYMLSRLVQAILDYFEMDINVMNKELTIVNNELSIKNVHDKQLVCDYRIKINEELELNVEVNKSYYAGVVERNMGYCFKIYGDHFNSGDKYNEFKKYCLIQVNFNNFSHNKIANNYVDKHDNNDTIREFYLIDVKNHKNFLSKNICIVNIDIEECFKLVYNKDKLREMSDLEKFGALLKADNIKDISHILEKSMIDMNEKEKFVEQIKDTSKEKEVLEAVKFEDSIDYRFNLVEEDALERGKEVGKELGIELGKEENTIEMIKNLLDSNVDMSIISKASGKSIQEIKEIANSIKE